MKHLHCLCFFIIGSMLSAAEVRYTRPLTSDRPDATESPFTVEPGGVQLEMSLAEYTRNRRQPDATIGDTSAWSALSTNLRIGLHDQAELQMVFAGFLREKETPPADGDSTIVEGAGDVTLRTKFNLWGNDGQQRTALGLMPFVTLPSGSDGLRAPATEGGVIAPFALKIPRDWSLGAMTAVEWRRDAADTRYETHWINTLTCGHALWGELAGFLELATSTHAGTTLWQGNCGLTYAWSERLQLDVGLNLGLSRAAEDLSVFAGFVQRF